MPEKVPATTQARESQNNGGKNRCFMSISPDVSKGWSPRKRVGVCREAKTGSQFFRICVPDCADPLAPMLSGISQDVKTGRAMLSRRDVFRRGQPRKCIGQFFAVERLDQKTVYSGLETGVAVFNQRIGGQR